MRRPGDSQLYLTLLLVFCSWMMHEALFRRAWSFSRTANSLHRCNGLQSINRMASIQANAAGPKRRDFIPIPYSEPKNVKKVQSLRVMQFNILADGLAGLRPDLGAFSRAKHHFMAWSDRKGRLLQEIVQYNADIVTLQECDHFYDFFLPEMEKRGYCGLFAPKPASACLEVSDNSDGCAVFFKRNRLEILSVEILTYSVRKAAVVAALSQAMDRCREQITESTVTNTASKAGVVSTHELEDLTALRSQNQVALVLSGLLLSGDPSLSLKESEGAQQLSLPIVLATTHLKASKTPEGEIYRLHELRQLLSTVERTCGAVQCCDIHGRFPAVIITGDLNATPDTSTSDSKTEPPINKNPRLDSDLKANEVPNVIARPSNSNGGYPSSVYRELKAHPLQLRSALNDDLAAVIEKTTGAATNGTQQNGQISSIWTTWKARRRGNHKHKLKETTAEKSNTAVEESIVKHCIDYLLYRPLPAPGSEAALSAEGKQTAQVGVRASRVLRGFSDQEVDPVTLLPSLSYPSDHVSIVADLDIVVPAS